MNSYVTTQMSLVLKILVTEDAVKVLSQVLFLNVMVQTRFPAQVVITMIAQCLNLKMRLIMFMNQLY